MFHVEKSLIATVLFAASASLAGCANEASEDASKDTTTEPQPPALPTFSADGVHLETSTADHAAGSFERRGATIRFDLAFDRETDVHHVLLMRVSGAPLFESTLRDGVDASSYLGGKVKTTGRLGEEPTKDGDVSALDELSAMPEAKAMVELKEALGAAGVSEALFRVKPPSQTSSIAPQVYGAGGTTPWPDNTWRILGSQESVSFYSWGFWSQTLVAIDGADGYASASFRAGIASPEYVSGWGTQYYYRQWWGAYVVVTNIRVPLCSVSWPYTCQNAAMWVLVK